MSAARTKNCQGWRPWSARTRASSASTRLPVASGFSRTESVEVAEFIVEALVQSGIRWRKRLCLRGRRPARPADGGNPHRDGAASADEIRKQPGQAVEAAVDRGHQDVLAKLVDEC